MRVLFDYHHGALLRSMYYLFGKRMGCELFLPTGMDWLDKSGLYSNYPNRDTAKQMLITWETDYLFPLHFKPMSEEEFAESNIDIVVATLLENYHVYKKLIKRYNKKTKLILHIGNNNKPEMLEQMGVENLLSSSWPTFLKVNIPNKVYSRQEFSLEHFRPKFNCNIRSVANYKHILTKIELDWFLKIEKQLPNWEFKCYGVLNRDGTISQEEPIMSESIRNFGFIFHYKTIDEGFGHCIHNAFACGKPVITSPKTMGVNWYGEFIKSTPAFLFEDDKTILNIDINSVESICYKLEKMVESYEEYSKYTYNKFKEICDFDKEFMNVRKFIDKLL
jgi:hypothetical protein